MKVGLVEYPGSERFADFESLFKKLPNIEAFPLWHKSDSLQGAELVLIPGGFSFGDYLRPGALAKLSRISGVITHFANSGGRVLGIGNGFQILCELGLLPGAFYRNPTFRFCQSMVRLKAVNTSSPFTSKLEASKVYSLPLSCNFGRYFVDGRGLEEMENEGQIVFQYATAKGKVVMPDSLTESVNAIAALTNKDKNVFGILAHPERAVDPLLGSSDGLTILSSCLQAA